MTQFLRNLTQFVDRDSWIVIRNNKRFTINDQRSTIKHFYRFFSKIIIFILIFSLIIPPSTVRAQAMLPLPTPGTMVTPTPAFVPSLLKGMTVHPEDPLKFDFIIDSGNSESGIVNRESNHETRTTNDYNEEFKKESKRLIKYFLASLTVPKDELWVNLSPNEKDRIIPDALGQTDLGRDLLAQDYILKQLTASLMYPEDELGKKFWDKVYKEAFEKYGTTDIPVDTFNKVWIIPESASVYENGNTVFIVDSKLKVLLEQDYLSLERSKATTTSTQKNSIATDIIREIIIPAIEKEVNYGEHFAPLRQIYNSLILAKWYKDTIKNSILSSVYVDKNKTAGINNEDPKMKEKIYDQYMQAYKKGVYNYIKDEYDPTTKDIIPRKYFSGGFREGNFKVKKAMTTSAKPVGDFAQIAVELDQQVMKDQYARSQISQKHKLDFAQNSLENEGRVQESLKEYIEKAIFPKKKEQDFRTLVSVVKDETGYDEDKIKNFIDQIIGQYNKGFIPEALKDNSEKRKIMVMGAVLKLVRDAQLNPMFHKAPVFAIAVNTKIWETIISNRNKYAFNKGQDWDKSFSERIDANGSNSKWPNELHDMSTEEHGEINVLSEAVKEGWKMKDTEVYISLESCENCAFGIANIFRPKKVFIATVDAFLEIQGKGNEIITDAGIDLEKFPPALEKIAQKYNSDDYDTSPTSESLQLENKDFGLPEFNESDFEGGRQQIEKFWNLVKNRLDLAEGVESPLVKLNKVLEKQDLYDLAKISVSSDMSLGLINLIKAASEGPKDKKSKEFKLLVRKRTRRFLEYEFKGACPTKKYDFKPKGWNFKDESIDDLANKIREIVYGSKQPEVTTQRTLRVFVYYLLREKNLMPNGSREIMPVDANHTNATIVREEAYKYASFVDEMARERLKYPSIHADFYPIFIGSPENIKQRYKELLQSGLLGDDIIDKVYVLDISLHSDSNVRLEQNDIRLLKYQEFLDTQAIGTNEALDKARNTTSRIGSGQEDEAMNVKEELKTALQFIEQRDIADIYQEFGLKKYQRQADALLILGTIDEKVIKESAKMLAAGVAKKMIISGGQGRFYPTLQEIAQSKYKIDITKKECDNEAALIKEIMLKIAAAKNINIDPGKIFIETKASITPENFSKSVKRFNLQGQTIIYVQLPYQQWRSKLAFEKLNKDSNWEIEGISYAPYKLSERVNTFNKDEMKEAIRMIAVDLAKIIEYGPEVGNNTIASLFNSPNLQLDDISDVYYKVIALAQKEGLTKEAINLNLYWSELRSKLNDAAMITPGGPWTHKNSSIWKKNFDAAMLAGILIAVSINLFVLAVILSQTKESKTSINKNDFIKKINPMSLDDKVKKVVLDNFDLLISFFTENVAVKHSTGIERTMQNWTEYENNVSYEKTFFIGNKNLEESGLFDYREDTRDEYLMGGIYHHTYKLKKGLNEDKLFEFIKNLSRLNAQEKIDELKQIFQKDSDNTYQKNKDDFAMLAPRVVSGQLPVVSDQEDGVLSQDTSTQSKDQSRDHAMLEFFAEHPILTGIAVITVASFVVNALRDPDKVVNDAIDGLNRTSNVTMAKGYVMMIAKHPDANPFAIPSLRNVALKHFSPEVRSVAYNSLEHIAETHADEVVRNRAQQALDYIKENDSDSAMTAPGGQGVDAKDVRSKMEDEAMLVEAAIIIAIIWGLDRYFLSIRSTIYKRVKTKEAREALLKNISEIKRYFTKTHYKVYKNITRSSNYLVDGGVNAYSSQTERELIYKGFNPPHFEDESHTEFWEGSDYDSSTETISYEYKESQELDRDMFYAFLNSVNDDNYKEKLLKNLNQQKIKGSLKKGLDEAMTTNSGMIDIARTGDLNARGINSSPEEKGGIDLNNIDVERQGDGRQIIFEPQGLDAAMTQSITGFTPVIINITPISNILPLLGLADPDAGKGNKQTTKKAELVAKEQEDKV